MGWPKRDEKNESPEENVWEEQRALLLGNQPWYTTKVGGASLWLEGP